LISNSTRYFKQSYKSKISLMDIAVGRGGDLAKWNKSGIDNVYGFDISKTSIEEAKNRIKAFKGLKINIHVEQGNATEPNQLSIDSFKKENDISSFQIISCQFALHYFFDDETSIRNVLKVVSQNLRTGGYFIGTTMNKQAILELFNSVSKTQKTIRKKLFQITRDFTALKRPPTFGQEYTFTILDTQDEGNYFNTIPESTEYLVDFNKLNEYASEFGLVECTKNFFEPYGNNFTEIRRASCEKIPSNVIPFSEIKWNGTPQLTPEELELNNLYCSFVYQKR